MTPDEQKQLKALADRVEKLKRLHWEDGPELYTSTVESIESELRALAAKAGEEYVKLNEQQRAFLVKHLAGPADHARIMSNKLPSDYMNDEYRHKAELIESIQKVLTPPPKTRGREGRRIKMSIYPIDTLKPGDRVKVAWIHESANCRSFRTDVITVARIENDLVVADDGTRYGAMCVSGLAEPTDAEG